MVCIPQHENQIQGRNQIQNRKVSVSNPTDALGQALGPNIITRLSVTFRSYLK